jgi:hypothetical protein
MSIIAQRFSQSIQRSNVNTSSIENIRKTRNVLLANSDWTQLPDNGLSDSKRAEWVVYRQALRDITNTVDLSNVVWPIAP